MRFLGKLVGNSTFWWFAIGIPAGLWMVLAFIRLAIYSLRQLQANAWDKRREQVILQEVRRGRRALQILSAECLTAHSNDLSFAPIAEALQSNEDRVKSQSSWSGGTNIRHSRLPVTLEMSPDEQVSTSFSALLKKLITLFSQLPLDHSVAVLLESSSSLPDVRIKALWQKAWQQAGISQPTFFVEGQGLAVIDHWLDHSIKEQAILLVVTLQVAPEQPEETAEAVAALLLGNQLTQKILDPLALLHRPEASSACKEALQAAVLQAIDWVPLPPGALQHLWLSGLVGNSKAWKSAMAVQSHEPLNSINAKTGTHDINQFLGNPGCVAPWLAIAAAAQNVSDSPHMIISSEQDSDIVWSTVVSPVCFSQGE